MTYRLGRLLQLVGLIILPIAVAGNLAEIAAAGFQLTLMQSLILSTVGVTVFYLGWSLQQGTKPQ